MHAPALPLIPSDLLLLAYRNGIFPMADHRDDPEVFWVEPRRRAILPLDGFHLSRSLAKTIRRDRFRVSCNEAFADVIAACAEPRPDHPESWISGRIVASYRALHAEGHAHSIECWRDGDLVGGLYGVGFGGVFCGESMFSRADDASKVALAWLVAVMRRAGSTLLDCQFMTDHLASLGAVEIAQARYVALLGEAAAADAAALPDEFGALEGEAAGAGLPPSKLILQSLTHTS
ncbi:leucyl/phenylalanyl-tRNA--protein transferase [Tsuneonella sp. SYSU-LHT278]|uniref:leucyl/phenylalanyl-tRNA--protein transferase n=1 Tax=Tsuneonella sediminis TaxID=3416089 RepID=UPI003F79587C